MFKLKMEEEEVRMCLVFNLRCVFVWNILFFRLRKRLYVVRIIKDNILEIIEIVRYFEGMERE